MARGVGEDGESFLRDLGPGGLVLDEFGENDVIGQEVGHGQETDVDDAPGDLVGDG